MATFQVPQFIEQKPKIVGPLTLSQFFYLAGAAAISFASFYIFTLFLWLVITMFVAAIGAGLAFGKVNGQPMPSVLASAFGFFLKPRFYMWQRPPSNTTISTDALEEITALRKNAGFQQKLRSIILDVTTSKSPSAKDIRKRGGAGEPEYELATFATGETRRVKRVDFSE